MREWWYGLEARERQTLTIGGAALAVILFFFAVWLPAQQGVDAMEQRVSEQRELLGWMQRSAAEVKALRGQGASAPKTRESDQALYALADETAREAGLGEAIREVSPTGENRVRVDLQGADFDKLIRWLADLRTQFGIQASPISVRRSDQPGRVNAQIVLEEQQT
jgi:general secretion pathway protein M